MARAIVVADDDVDVVRAIADALEDAGYVVVTTVGARTLGDIQQHTPDVVLLDYQMPGMDGISVANQIRSQPELRDTRIVAMTGMSRTEWISDQMHADAYLCKPFDISELMEVVRA